MYQSCGQTYHNFHIYKTKARKDKHDISQFKQQRCEERRKEKPHNMKKKTSQKQNTFGQASNIFTESHSCSRAKYKSNCACIVVYVCSARVAQMRQTTSLVVENKATPISMQRNMHYDA